MAGAPILEVRGARRLRRDLKRAGDDLEELKATHARVAAIVAATATSTAPRRSGRLAATVRPAGTKTQAVIRAGYARVPYANPIHWGWPRRGIRANPWLSEAAQTTEPAWYRAYALHVDQLLNRVEGA